MPKTGSALLSETAVRNARPKEKQYLLRDGEGLLLVVEPSGRKWWKLRTVFAKRESSFSLGSYPDTSLALARQKKSEYRTKIAEGMDPTVYCQSLKAAMEGDGSFESVAMEWFEKFSKQWSKSHSDRIISRLKSDVFPYIGRRSIKELSAPEILAVLRRVEKRALETAHRVKMSIGQIFRYAVASGYAESDPVGALKGALPPATAGHMAAPTSPETLAPLLRMIDGYQGSFVVQCALRLAPLLFARPGELRTMEWAHIDFEKAEWAYTVSKTKTDHLVPLSRQAIEILQEIEPLTGSGRYVFPSARTKDRPMSENALGAGLKRLGIDTRSELTVHGWRACARTLLHEVLAFDPRVIELQLAHRVPDVLGTAYNRTQFIDERRRMMSVWSDYLDSLKESGRSKVIPIHKRSGTNG